MYSCRVCGHPRVHNTIFRIKPVKVISKSIYFLLIDPTLQEVENLKHQLILYRYNYNKFELKLQKENIL